MSSILDFAWLIPASPLVGSCCTLLLLVSFNRTINRLTKPVSWLLISCIFISTFLSFFIYQKHYEAELFDYNLIFSNIDLHLEFYVDTFLALISTICGFAMLIIMIASYLSLERRTGYVRYFAFLSIFFGLIFSFIFSGNTFYDLVSLG